MTAYHDFLARKAPAASPAGMESIPSLPAALKPFQRDIVAWALRHGRCAIFAGTGLGKTLMQLAWGSAVANHTEARCLLLAPLAVAQQTVVEARRFGIPSVEYASSQDEASSTIAVTNYDRLHLFDPSAFAAVILDESSIIKSHDSKTRRTLIESFGGTPWRLCCTATPAPNDYVELGNHSEFLGIMSAKEMLSMFFVHDGKVRAAGAEGSDGWRLKRHAEKDFWRWLASWAVVIRDPNEIGYDEPDYVLPPLNQHQITVRVAYAPSDTALFPMEARTMQERIGARRDSIRERIAAAAQLIEKGESWLGIGGSGGKRRLQRRASDASEITTISLTEQSSISLKAGKSRWVIWCHLNKEQESMEKALNPSEVFSIYGSTPRETKVDYIMRWLDGERPILLTKPSIMGWGMNLQCCNRMVFLGISDSFEELFQAIRRCWRFGQTKPVNVYLISSEIEGAVLANVERKEADYERMSTAMADQMRDLVKGTLRAAVVRTEENKTDSAAGDRWKIRLGDAVEEMRAVAGDSVHFSLHSPPFCSLYTFSDSLRDLSNCADDDTFWRHYQFVIAELYRTTMPGRLCAIHCMNLPTSKLRDGFIGIRDFRGDIIRAFQAAGFCYHSEICIRKDPVSAMQRSKSIGLLHKQVVKDSSLSRQAVADYVVVMRKPGDNPEPVKGGFEHYYGTGDVAAEDPGVEAAHIAGSYSVKVWQRYAEPVWMDIAQSDVLSNRLARAVEDERHIAPLQLTVIRRCYQIWTNPGDLVLSPFAGIGSEGCVAIEMGRRFLGIELKESYYDQAVANLRATERSVLTGTLFDLTKMRRGEHDAESENA